MIWKGLSDARDEDKTWHAPESGIQQGAAALHGVHLEASA
jgi:hypothetical protein